MNKNGRPKGRHLVDGQEMTVEEIAGMLGLTPRALEDRRKREAEKAILAILKENRP